MTTPHDLVTRNTCWSLSRRLRLRVAALSLNDSPPQVLQRTEDLHACLLSCVKKTANILLVAVQQVRTPRHTHVCTRCRSPGLARRICRGGTRHTCGTDVLCRKGGLAYGSATCSVALPHTAWLSSSQVLLCSPAALAKWSTFMPSRHKVGRQILCRTGIKPDFMPFMEAQRESGIKKSVFRVP